MYTVAWKLAKRFMIGKADVEAEIPQMVEGNWRRKNIFPALLRGFRRVADPRFGMAQVPTRYRAAGTGRWQVPGFGNVRLHELVRLQSNDNEALIVYPYYFSTPRLTAGYARMMLAVLKRNLPAARETDIAIYDIAGGVLYRHSEQLFEGDEDERLADEARMMLRDWRAEYVKAGGR